MLVCWPFSRGVASQRPLAHLKALKCWPSSLNHNYTIIERHTTNRLAQIRLASVAVVCLHKQASVLEQTRVKCHDGCAWPRSSALCHGPLNLGPVDASEITARDRLSCRCRSLGRWSRGRTAASRDKQLLPVRLFGALWHEWIRPTRGHAIGPNPKRQLDLVGAQSVSTVQAQQIQVPKAKLAQER